VTSDGTKLMVYGAGSSIEYFDAKTLKSMKLLYLNKDTTTNVITLAGL
jgi:ssRNA-specific RNase YbeY (16S rRNA maturation enzyme)